MRDARNAHVARGTIAVKMQIPLQPVVTRSATYHTDRSDCLNSQRGEAQHADQYAYTASEQQ